MGPIATILVIALNLYIYILLAKIILSWIPSLPEPLLPVARFLSAVTDPVLEPLRRRLPPLRLGMVALDLSPILVFFAIRLLVIPLVARLPI